MSQTGMTAERVYLHLRSEITARETLQTRVDVLEHFIKMQFPEFFAGEAETVVDLELNPIPIVYGEPQENDPAKWKRPAGEAEIADLIRQGKIK